MKRAACIIAFLICVTAFSQNDDGMKTFDPNFVHVVYFWLHNPDNPEDRAAFEAAIDKLLDSSKYTKTNYLGTPPQSH